MVSFVSCFSRYSLTIPRWLATLTQQHSGAENHTTQWDMTMLSNSFKTESGYTLHSRITVVTVLFAESDLGLSFFPRHDGTGHDSQPEPAFCGRQANSISSQPMRRRLMRLRIGSAARWGIDHVHDRLLLGI